MLSSKKLSGAVGVPMFILLASACVGREVSLGTNSSSLALVDPATVSEVPKACGAGDAHSNVCCDAAPGSQAKCGIYPGAPFHPCDSGWKTYPNPNECCALDDPTKCAPPPPTSEPPPSSCYYGCPAGWYSIPNGCCQVDPSGNEGTCYGWASSGDAGYADAGYPDVSVSDAGPAPDAGGPTPGPAPDSGVIGTDSGSFDAEVVPCAPNTVDIDGSCVAVEPPPPPPCDLVCPPGWKAADNSPDICCRETGGGDFECFSQGTGPLPQGGPAVDGGPAPDGGVVVADAGADCFWDGGVCLPCFAADAGAGACSAARMVGGHCYEVICGHDTSCSCIVDDVVKTSTPQQPNVCSGDLFTEQSKACNFPF